VVLILLDLLILTLLTHLTHTGQTGMLMTGTEHGPATKERELLMSTVVEDEVAVHLWMIVSRFLTLLYDRKTDISYSQQETKTFIVAV
jgi:hypothetical protein